MMDETKRRLLEHLPEASRKRVLTAQQEVDAIAAMGRTYADRQRELQDDIAKEERWIEQNTTVGRIPETDPTIKTARQSVELKRSELRDLAEAVEARRGRSRELSTQLTRAFDLIANVARGGKILVAVGDREVAPRRGEDFAAAIDRCRNKVVECTSKIAEIAAAPRPSETVKQDMRAEISAIAAAGRPDVTFLFSDGRIEWPANDAAHEAAFKLAVWANHDAIVAALEKQIDNEANDDEALTPSERESLTRKFEAMRLDAEREEVALIDAATAAGISISQRPGLSAVAWLKVSDTFPPGPKQAAPQYRSQDVSGQRRATPAPIHPSSLMPEPALRGQI